MIHLRNVLLALFFLVSQAEHDPIDVPAIPTKWNEKMLGCLRGTICENDWTCADKSRALLRSEDDKVWCHKIQN